MQRLWLGFVRGVNKAFREQEEQHQEWGLVMVVPQAVDDSMADMGKRRSLALSRPAAGATPTAPWAFRTADGLTPHPACLMVFLDSL